MLSHATRRGYLSRVALMTAAEYYRRITLP
jgi:hypothetical protein